MANKEEKRVDLHIHSTYSDGIFTPYEIANKAYQSGLSAIAITDHDTILGLQELKKIDFIEVIPGIEISSKYEGVEYHILGYFIDPLNEKLAVQLESYKQIRENRVKNILDQLGSIGIEIDYQEIKNLSKDGTIGRPHIARKLVEKGYVQSENEAFDELLEPARPGFVPRSKVNPKDAINLIKESGGLSFLAHPDHSNDNTSQLLDVFIEWGIDGIEISHPSQVSVERQMYWYKIAKDNGLLVSGGSDYHGDDDPPVQIGDVYVPYSYLEDMKEKLCKKDSS
ncbi:PHP domain-containing protein [Natranaerofaba carboxydovora]|uniref:PHP domain-containing protein n=1 Tax=Natranaerofaba carboxydovora TaxID=2742683 RepID=UPI001F13EB64|nr:PHP domain-containing protein [Natranaerofaba carboxydovora]UMZ73482.1 5'-3' exoribonuclease [Natranaerofaba carboxydovora]